MDASQRSRHPARTPSAPAAATSLRSRLTDLAEALDQARRLERLVKIADDPTTTRGKPVSDRIQDLLRSNPDMSFSPAEIMECIHVSDRHIESVRKALQRLCARNAIIRVGYGEYRTNAPPTEGPTP